jgi:polygalacturonase
MKDVRITPCAMILILLMIAPRFNASRAQSREGENLITVGLSGADINGRGNVAIQAAIDMVHNSGGGKVVVLPGEYILDDAIRMRSNVHLAGDRNKTILKHAPAVSCPLLKDADIGQKEVTPKDPSLFKPGMGIVCRSNRLANTMVNTPLTITHIKNGVLYLNGYIKNDFIADLNSQGEGGSDGLVANIFPLVYGYEIENAIIEGLTIDSKVEENPGWVNVRTAGVCLDRTKFVTVRNVKSVNNQGDGILTVSSEHTTIEDCEGAYNTYHGIHPGSHSPWTVVRRCVMHHNGSDGLYICWGIRESEFTDNVIYNNGIRKVGKRNGISIGHKDTDNLIARNHIYENAVAGIYFRQKTEANGAHRNIIRDNIIENNGLAEHSDKGYGIFISGISHDIRIENNTIRETRSGNEAIQKNALCLQAGVSKVQMVNNKISPHPGKAIVDNSQSPDNRLQVVPGADK